MKVALTGAAGFIGSRILTELHENGHEVIALVRDDAQADVAKARGATPVVVDLYDRPAVTSLLAIPTRPSAPPLPVTLPAQAWTPQLWTRPPARSPAPASPTSTSVAIGSTGITPPSPRTLPSMRPRWWQGSCRSNAGYSTRPRCAAW